MCHAGIKTEMMQTSSWKLQTQVQASLGPLRDDCYVFHTVVSMISMLNVDRSLEIAFWETHYFLFVSVCTTAL